MNIGLTGCRYSGKSKVSSTFTESFDIPVFDADVALKFLINFRVDLDEKIKNEIGSEYYTMGFIDPNKINSAKIQKVIDICESDLFIIWENFKKRYSNSKNLFIFKSSILFETKWSSKFDKVICVFAPKDKRVSRMKQATSNKIDVVWNFLNTEMSDLDKNKLSDFIIHSYENGPSILNQVREINKVLNESNTV